MNDREINRLAKDLFNLLKLLPQLRPEMQTDQSLSRSEWELLAFIAIKQRDEGRLFSATEISNLLGITPAAITHMINPLEEGHYVERINDEKDRRLVLIGLTPKGGKAAEAMIANFQDKLSGFIAHLGVEDSQTFIRLMDKLLNYFSAMIETAEA